MGFPTSIEGRIQLDPREHGDLDVLTSQVEQSLTAARATSVTRTGNKVSATVGLFDLRVMSFDMLAFVDSGEVEVIGGTPISVSYCFPCRRSLIFVSFAAGVFAVGLVAFAVVVRALPLLGLAFVFPLAMWLLMFGLNYVVAAGRITGMLYDIGT